VISTGILRDFAGSRKMPSLMVHSVLDLAQNETVLNIFYTCTIRKRCRHFRRDACTSPPYILLPI